MFMRTIGRRGISAFIVGALSFAVPLANGQTPVTPSADARPRAASEAPTSSSEIDQLRKMILEQQRQIDNLKRTMADQKSEDSTVQRNLPLPQHRLLPAALDRSLPQRRFCRPCPL